MTTTNPLGASLLFVDDEPWFSESTVEELQDAGFEVVSCTTATEALDALESDTKFEVVVLDIMMPPGDRVDDPENGRRAGLRLHSIIRNDLKLTIPIVFLTVVEEQTAHDKITQLEEDAGMIPTILVKPVSPSQIVTEVCEVLRQARGELLEE